MTPHGFAYQTLRIDAMPYEVAAYLDASPRWEIIPDPDEKLDHLAATHTTGNLVHVPYTTHETAEREQLLAAVMHIAAHEVAWAPDATDRDRAAVIVYLTGIMQELRPEPPTRRRRPSERAEGSTVSEDRATAGVSDYPLHLALAYIRALTRMEPTPAEREAAERRSYPAMMACYTCAYDGIEVERPVAALGDIVNPADPTQTYRLACGHTTF
ncbi:hypothetical protein AB0K18_42945 [Nonomuraea sp. NPDC049421]|uniref:hypothetical protein n=1 Tax=Nonomuraea sp. NPDC049421 TaxID=3155275 RepID=UPI0034122831